MIARHARALTPLLALALGCDAPESSSSSPGGTVIIATGADADHVLPPLVATSVGKQVSDALFLPIARIGDSLNMLGDDGFTGLLAVRWDWSTDSLAIRFELDPAARWHDGTPVRAQDVAFSLDTYRSKAIGADVAPRLADVASLTVEDSLAFTVTWQRRSATQFHDFVSHLVPIPRHVYGVIPADSLRASAAARSPVGSGKFRFSAWDAGMRVEVVADTAHWLGRPSLDRVIWSVVPDPNTQLAQLLVGEADFVETLRGPALRQAAADTSLRFSQRPGLDFGLALFNLRARRRPAVPHPLFGDQRVRQALTLALDREALVRAVLDTLGSAMTSPFLSVSGMRGAMIPGHDQRAAIALLEEAGFRDANGDGVRERDGVPLQFTLTAPGTSPTRTRYLTLLAAAWKEVGARVIETPLDNAKMMADNEAGDFDVSLLGFSGTPDPKALEQAWTTGAPSTGRYNNPAVRAAFDTAAGSPDGRVARAQYVAAARRMIEDAPAVWLYEVRSVAGYHSRLRPVGIRPDAWWAHLDEWSVDPAHLKPRDRVGVAPAKAGAPP